MQEHNERKQAQNINRRNAEVRPAGTAGAAMRRRQPQESRAAAPGPVRRPVRKRRRKRTNRALRIIAAAVFAAALLVLLIILMHGRAPKELPRSYPMKYTDLIRSNAAMQGIEPAQVAAVILAESGYDPNAVSSVNAQGLMQIMPDTGKWLAGKFDEEYVEGCLFDPATNIRYGCWYLGYLMRRYDGDLTCATAAYHSGQGTVDGWLADPAFSSDGKSLIDIKGKNAKTYVSRVLEYYEEYQELYGPA